MAPVSDRLRAARERARLQIADVSATTRIKPAFLQAMEAGEFDRLPGEFFTRAFLRTYARELKLDADAILRDYDSARMVTDVPAPARRSAPAKSAAPEMPSRSAAPARSARPRRHATWPVVAAAAGLLLALSLFNSAPASRRAIEPGAVGTIGTAEAAPATPTARASTPATHDLLRLEIRPVNEIWVTAYADGERVVYRLLHPGEHVALEARHQFSLRVGQASALEYTINGVPGKALGRPGEVRDVQITRDNYRTFQRPQEPRR